MRVSIHTAQANAKLIVIALRVEYAHPLDIVHIHVNQILIALRGHIAQIWDYAKV